MSKLNKKDALTYREAADMIGVGTTTISNYAKLYKIPRGSMKVGGAIRGVVSKTHFEKFVYDKNYLRDNDQVVWED